MRLDDGIARVLRMADEPSSGSLPILDYTEVFASYYANRTVGFARFFTAQANNQQIDVMIRIQRFGVSISDIIVLEPTYDTDLADRYKVLQVQQIVDEDGLFMTDLSLERLVGVNEPQ